MAAIDLTPDEVTEVREVYAPLIKSIQNRRIQVEQDWLRWLSAWKGVHTRPGFKGEWFNHYIPALRRAVERFVTRCTQMLFPSPDFFEVYPMDDRRVDLGEQAEAWKGYLLWLLAARIRARQMTKQLIRCYLLFQRAILKTGVDATTLPDGRLFVWPTARPVDPFAFYIWPETATTLDEAQVIVEHALMPWDTYRVHADQGIAEAIEKKDLQSAEWPSWHIRRLQESGVTVPTDTASGPQTEDKTPPAQPPVAFVALSELWFRRDGRWRQVWIVWNVQGGPRVVRAKATVPVPPYRMALARQVPGEHYSTSMAADLEPFNVLLNDEVNMTLEGQATALNPPVAIDPDAVARADTLVFRPRARWLVKPEGIQWMRPPDTVGVGFQAIQMVFGFIDSFSGSNPLAEGQPTRGMPRAGFAVSSLIGLSMADIKDVAETIEDELLTPMLSDLYALTLRFVPRGQLVRLPGSEKLITTTFSVQDLIGNYAFKWVGSLQSQDLMVRAQRGLTLMNVLAKLYEPMSRQGWEVDFGVLGKRLWRDWMGERGADTIIVRADSRPDLASQTPATGSVASGGGGGAPAPATPEQAERQIVRGMTEAGPGPLLTGLKIG